jgi:hypothetical protein
MATDDNRIPTPEELAAIELRCALTAMGPDTDRALMLTLRLPDGTHAGDVWLSTTDVRALIDGAASMALVSGAEQQMAAYDDDTDPPAGPLPLAEDDLTDQFVKDGIQAFEEFLKNEGGQE